MPSLTCFKYRFTSNWKLIVLSTCAFFLLIFLGFWQLERGDEKKTLLSMQAELVKRPPFFWRKGMPLPKQEQRIRVAGIFLPQSFMLDNQFYKHQFGFDVINPLQLSSGEVILVDRGWIKSDASRRVFPTLPVPKQPLKIIGSAYYPSNKTWVLGQDSEKKDDSTIIIERVDTKLIGQFLHKPVYPFIIRLDKEDANGYVRQWSVVARPPERHYAYAFQWFAMAFVILMLLILNLKNTHEKSKW
jgi:surfeit locus 1 family protein